MNRANHAKELSGLIFPLRSYVAPLEGFGPARGHLLPSVGCAAPNLLTLSKGKENNLREITARLNQLWLFCSPGADVIHLSRGQIKRTVLSKLIPTAEKKNKNKNPPILFEGNLKQTKKQNRPTPVAPNQSSISRMGFLSIFLI